MLLLLLLLLLLLVVILLIQVLLVQLLLMLVLLQSVLLLQQLPLLVQLLLACSSCHCWHGCLLLVQAKRRHAAAKPAVVQHHARTRGMPARARA